MPLQNAIAASVEHTFVTDNPRLRQFKLSEVKRRTDLAVEIVSVLRHDMKWGVDRTVGMLPKLLRKAVDGEDWSKNVERCTLWTSDTLAISERFRGIVDL